MSAPLAIQDVVETLDAFGPDTPGEVFVRLFADEPDRLLAAIVDAEGRPVGLVDRQSFLLHMASRYGRALYASRPISLIMDSDPLLVDAGRALEDFTAAALSARPSDLLKGFIAVEDGRYLGVGAVLGVLGALSDQARRTAAELAHAADELRRAHAETEREKLFAASVIENMPAMLFVRSLDDDRFILVNRAAEETLGYAREALIGRSVADVFPPDQAAAFAAQDAQVRADSAGELVVEERVRRRDGEERRFRTRKLTVADEAGAPRWLLCVSEDITERRAAQAQIERLAHYDPLTGLANRALFSTQLQSALAEASKTGTSAAALCIDLDRFKAVNDSLGHAAGDALLQAVAERLRTCVRADDAVARLGGDEFAVLQSGEAGADGAQRLGARIVQSLSQPYEIAGQRVTIGASVGVALYPADGVSGADLLKRADMALYRAKSAGRGRVRLFSADMDAELQARVRLEADLRRAVAEGELVLHFQPFTDLADGDLAGCEALVRWNHPQRGLVGPGEFIGVAEEIGLIRPLGEWVLRAACEEAAKWPAHMRLAVNVSPLQFKDRRLAKMVASALATSGLEPHRLELEITESVLLKDDEANLRMLHQLKNLGCRIALDDFGTGYSALSYLRLFPFDKIKIDRTFVKDLPHDTGSLSIVRAVTELARGLGVTTTAEGVETAEQLATMRSLGCNYGQGFLLAKPAPADAALLLLRSRVQQAA